MNKTKAAEYYRCEDCNKDHGVIRGAFEGAICPVHGKPLFLAGTLEEIYRQTFKKDSNP